jgi:hypothetical protein
MCTVTVLPCRVDGAAAVRLACNRDEQRARPAALPPQLRRLGRLVAAWPTDPAGGGTWVGVNDAGLALALLNVTIAPGARRGPIARSRGAIIPDLLGCGDLDLALRQAAALDPALHAPFRLVLVAAGRLAEAMSDGKRLRLAVPRPLATPLLFTSSGLGDEVVAGPRGELFGERLLATTGDPGTQDSFHRHHWPDRPHLSVCMRRPDARTVSYTTITLTAGRASLDYHAEAPDTPGERYSITLGRQGDIP